MKKMSKQRKIAILAIALCTMIGVGAAAQLFINIQNSSNWELASSKIQWSATWYDFGLAVETPMNDFAYMGGVISGEGNSSLTFNIKYFPNLDIVYEEAVSIRILDAFRAEAIDLTWDADNLVVGVGDLEYLRITARMSGDHYSLATTVISWDTDGVVTVGDFDYPAGAAGFPQDILIGMEFKWLTSNHVAFGFTVGAEAG
jgi:hypothetical protein